MTRGGSNFDDFPENQFTKCVQFKQYQGISGPRRTTRYFVQSKIFQFSLL